MSYIIYSFILEDSNPHAPWYTFSIQKLFLSLVNDHLVVFTKRDVPETIGNYVILTYFQ